MYNDILEWKVCEMTQDIFAQPDNLQEFVVSECDGYVEAFHICPKDSIPIKIYSGDSFISATEACLAVYKKTKQEGIQ